MNRNGFITSINAGNYEIYSDDKIYICKARGRFRVRGYVPKVGDNVIFDDVNNYILEIHKRKNELDRPPLSNIDQVCIVASVTNPYIQPSLINRYIVLSELINIKPILILSKIDLDCDSVTNKLKEDYERLGYIVYTFSSKTLEGLDTISKLFSKKKTVFTGQSGVGKSTLINCLIPGSRQKTNEISEALGRGKHTTRIISFLQYQDGFIADTPGFSSINIYDSLTKISYCYPGFDKYVGKCKYNDCIHVHEDGCAVKDDVEKGLFNKDTYIDYVDLITSIKERKF